ncbi:MAG: DUF4234 domain-containing protein [Eubacteriales bacterium]|nr:DUF4234 domain-containing protein [Eubacteriales bacterium]
MYCRECGTKIEPGAKFCAACGTPVYTDNQMEPQMESRQGQTAFESEPPMEFQQRRAAWEAEPQMEPEMEPERATRYAQRRQGPGQGRLESFNFLKFLLLTMVTFGIYAIITLYRFTNTVNELCEGDEQESPNYIIVVLLGIVTFGIYMQYWIYKQANRLLSAAPGYGCRVQESSTAILLWSTFGSYIVIGPAIAWYKMFQIINTLIRSYNRGKRQTRLKSGLFVAQKSRKPALIIAGFYLIQAVVIALLIWALGTMLWLLPAEDIYTQSDAYLSDMGSTSDINYNSYSDANDGIAIAAEGISLNESNVSQYYGTYEDGTGAFLEIGYMGAADRQRIHFYGFGDYSSTASVIGAGYLVSDYDTGDTGIWIAAYSDGSVYVDDKDNGVYTGRYYPVGSGNGMESAANSAGSVRNSAESAKSNEGTDGVSAIPENPNTGDVIGDAINEKVNDAAGSAADSLMNGLLNMFMEIGDDNVDKRNIHMYYGTWYDDNTNTYIIIEPGDEKDYTIDLSSLGYGKNIDGRFTASQTIYMSELDMGILMNDDGSIYLEKVSFSDEDFNGGNYIKQ